MIFMRILSEPLYIYRFTIFYHSRERRFARTKKGRSSNWRHEEKVFCNSSKFSPRCLILKFYRHLRQNSLNQNFHIFCSPIYWSVQASSLQFPVSWNAELVETFGGYIPKMYHFCISLHIFHWSIVSVWALI